MPFIPSHKLPGTTVQSRKYNRKAERKALRKQQRSLKKGGKKAKSIAKKQSNTNSEKKSQRQRQNIKSVPQKERRETSTPTVAKHKPKWETAKIAHRSNKNEEEDDPDARLVKKLERELGLDTTTKYWKKQEFANDNLDCFMDLGYFSGESDVDNNKLESFKSYFDPSNPSSTNATPKMSDESELEKYRQLKATQRQRTDDEQHSLTDNQIKERTDARRNRREMLYGTGVYHSSDEDDDAADNAADNESNPQRRKRNLVEMKSSDNTEINSFLQSDDDSDSGDKGTAIAAPPLKKMKNLKGKYVPPHLRKFQLLEDTDAMVLKRKLQPHLNRLSSQTLSTAVNTIVAFYTEEIDNSSAQITASVCESVFIMIDKEESNRSVEVMVLHLAALISGIYFNMGIFVGSAMIESLTNKFRLVLNEYHCADHSDSDSNNRRRRHLVSTIKHSLLLFCDCYQFGMVKSKFILEMLLDTVSHIDAYAFSVLTLPMQQCGAQWRTDDPILFRDLVKLIFETKKELNIDDLPPQQQYVLTTTIQLISDIKDNKTAENANADPQLQHLRQLVKAMKLRASSEAVYDLAFHIGYTDICAINSKGRWWLAGAPRKGHLTTKSGAAVTKPESVWRDEDKTTEFPEQLLEMAKKFHMNTPVRRAVFCIVMGSEDYIDAFQRLLLVNLSAGKDQEMIRIIVLLAMRQSDYNPYYHYLLGKLVKENKKWKFSLHCALWDRFKEIAEVVSSNAQIPKNRESMSTNDVLNLSKLLANLLHSSALNLVVLKNLDLMKAAPKNVLFVYSMFTALFEKNDNSIINRIFGSLSGNNQLRALRQEIEVFLNTVMLPRARSNCSKLKHRHTIAQKLFANQKIDKNKLTQLGLKLRNKENLLTAIRSALDSMQEYKVMSSVYDDL